MLSLFFFHFPLALARDKELELAQKLIGPLEFDRWNI